MSHRPPVFSRLALFLFAIVMWAAAFRLSAPAAGEAGGDITIASAIWGINTRTVDVTAKVIALLQPQAAPFVVNAASLGTDPAPGTKKNLVITYTYHGASNTLTLKSGQSVGYQALVDHATGTAAAGATTAPAPTATVRSNSGPQILSEDQMAGIVLIEGDKGVATGFLAKVHDTVCVVTNLHVLGDNEKFTIRNLQGDVVGVSAQGIIGAVGADIALLRLTDPATAPPALATADNVLQAAKIGDEVVVVGNRLGGGVATQTTGKIQGVGPARVEVDAAFQPGNSGSPIFDRASNQVVGVAAYAETVPLDALGNPARSGATALKRETRWFGYRLDSVTKWETIEWPKWRSQITQVTSYRETSLALLALLQGNLNAAREDAKLKRILEQYPLTARGSTTQTTEVRTMLAQARAYAQDTAKDLRGGFYDYFMSSLYWETSVPEQTKFRDLLLKAFAEVDSSLQTAQRGGG